MKVIAFNGSARPSGNTSILLDTVLKILEQEGIETERINMAGQTLKGCTACYGCAKRQNRRCVIESDPINTWIQKLCEADGVLLGAPVYFTDVPAEMKAFIDRVGFVARANGDLLKRKVGAAVVAVRRAGALHTFDTLNHFFTISQMVVPGSRYWNLGIGGRIGDVQLDEEGLETMRILGENMAWLLKKIH